MTVARAKGAKARRVSPSTVSMSVDEVLAWLRRKGSKRNVEGMARYGIVSPRAFGVSTATMRPLVPRLRRQHQLALDLWASGWLEARNLAALIDDPRQVTKAQMNRWVTDFDNWAVCDSCCFHLFDKTVYAWEKAEQWSKRRPEFVKRAGFALMASLAVHDKQAPHARFLELLPAIARGATDDRNYVKKAVSWALRSIGKRDATLHGPALALARELRVSLDSGSRWVGSDAARELERKGARGQT